MNRRPPLGAERRAATRPEWKNRNRKRFDVGGAVRFLFVMALVFECLRVAFASPRLRLQEMRVSGTARLTAAEVQKLSGVRIGQNIFSVNLVTVADRMQQEPIIQDAVVTRELPRAVNVEVHERVPALQIETRSGRFHADREGVVFERAYALKSQMPVLGLPLKDLPPLGGKLRPDLERAVWDCVRLSRKEGLALRYLRIDEHEELWLNVGTYPSTKVAVGRLKVRIGRLADLPEKFRDIHQSLQAWPQLLTTASHLDVMCAGAPAEKMAEEDASQPGASSHGSQSASN